MGDTDEADIVALEHTVMRAVQTRDLLTLERLIGDGFTLTTGRPGREVRTRAEWLRVTADEYVIEDYAFEHLDVRCFEGCAIASSRYRQRGRMGERSRNTTYRMTDVWVRAPSGWRLEARHAQPVEGD